MKKNKLFILIVISILLVIFTYNDDFLYKKEIMKITNIETINTTSQKNTIGLTEKYKTQKITGILTNGKNKGSYKTIEYEESYSSVVTDKYSINDKVILDKNTIDNLKRDYYIVLLFGSYYL